MVTAVTLGMWALAPTAHADGPQPTVDKVEISQLTVWASGADEAMTVSRSSDGTVFTVDDTKGWDAENKQVTMLSVAATLNVPIVGFIHSGNDNYWMNATNWNSKLAAQWAEMKPYETDPDYVIVTFTLYESVDTGSGHVAIPSTGTLFTLRLKKWERQYSKEISTPRWNDGNFFLSTDPINRVTWTPVPGQPHHYQVVAAQGVTFPYSLVARAAIHYQTHAYLEGAAITLPGPNTLWSGTLVFTSAKTSYEFRIDPPARGGWDDKHTTYVPAYFHVSVTGSDPPAGGTPGGGGSPGGGTTPGGTTPGGTAPGGGTGSTGGTGTGGGTTEDPTKATVKVAVKVKGAKATVTLKVAKPAAATGKVKLALTKKVGKKTTKIKWSGKAAKTVKLTAKSKGKATVTLPKLRTGTYTLTATFAGNAKANPAKGKATWRVR
jgi:hypothetical protein